MKNFYIPRTHDSCVRVLNFMLLLFQKDICLKDISDFDKKRFEDIEAPETFWKYIATLEQAGINVQKIGKEYSIKYFFDRVKLTDEEIDYFSKLYDSFDNCCIENQRSDFDKLFEVILKYLDSDSEKKLLKNIQKIKEDNQDKVSEIAAKYRQYVDLAQKIKIEYRGKTYIVEPKKIEIENKRVYLLAYNSEEVSMMKILTSDIKSVSILPSRVSPTSFPGTVVFKVYDRLAVNYRLRDCEKIQDFSDNVKVIANCGEAREQLIRRLLKYGENCEIISNNSFRDEFLQELDKIEKRLKGD